MDQNTCTHPASVEPSHVVEQQKIISIGINFSEEFPGHAVLVWGENLSFSSLCSWPQHAPLTGRHGEPSDEWRNDKLWAQDSSLPVLLQLPSLPPSEQERHLWLLKPLFWLYSSLCPYLLPLDCRTHVKCVANSLATELSVDWWGIDPGKIIELF